MALLDAVGWSSGETAFHGPQGLVWMVVLTKAGRVIRAEAPSQAEAWAAAVRLAELGPLSSGQPGPG